ncbi:MAG: MBOAT family protein [Bacteroidales bacterium]|nr:MBOAT family protein [Bacteroidales bacterium]
MLFNSIQFAVFLPLVFLLYWFVFDRFISRSKSQLRWQNAFIVVASYVFYGWWDWRFLVLIAITSFCSWGSGLLIGKAESKKKAKAWMWANIVLNLGILAVFKYYDFFVTEFAQLFHISTEGLLLKVILPVGISFYTFQALSYSVDIYRGKIEPTKDVIAFFAFISFFPQLVAGPIERATNLLPQFLKRREFDYNTAVDGMRQILWGLFKKIAVADNCAKGVSAVFFWSSRVEMPGSELLLAAVLFSFQIYADFSGYSDMAVGTAKLFGIRLTRNFNNPYFSRNIAEFWQRWHISLMSWFRDYVYIPLGGDRQGKARHFGNILIVFLLSGLWHGANWTFLAWGMYHALLFLPGICLGSRRRNAGPVQMLVTYGLVLFGWIIFRSDSLGDCVRYLSGMCQWGTLRASYRFFVQSDIWPKTVFIMIMMVVEWLQRGKAHGLEISNMRLFERKWVRWMLYLSILLCCITISSSVKCFDFIYFQF